MRVSLLILAALLSSAAMAQDGATAVSYTHLTLPTKRIV